MRSLEETTDPSGPDDLVALAVQRRDAPALAALLHAGASPRLADEAGLTPLMLASAGGDLPCAALLAPRSDIDASCRDRNTALMLAADAGDAPMLALLLAAGADPNLSDMEDASPLMRAAQRGHEDCARLLLGRCDLDAVDEAGSTALTRAAFEGHDRIVALLVEAGAHAGPDIHGWSPLMESAHRGRWACVEALLPWSDEDLRDRDGSTLADLARFGGHDELAEFLAARALARHEARSLHEQTAPARPACKPRL